MMLSVNILWISSLFQGLLSIQPADFFESPFLIVDAIHHIFCCLNSLICPIIHVVFFNLCLVGGIPTPLKNMKVSWDDYSHIYIYIWKNKKWSKPPTRCKGHLPTFRTSRCSSSILGNCMAWRSPALFWGKLPRGSFWWKRKNTAKYPLVMSSYWKWP